MTAHVLARSDTGFILEHACEVMRVIEAQHIRRFADTTAAHEDVFCDSDDVRLDIFLGGRTCRLFDQVAEITR